MLVVYYPLDYERIELSENWKFSILMMFYALLLLRSKHYVIGLYQNAFNDTPYSSYDLELFFFLFQIDLRSTIKLSFKWDRAEFKILIIQNINCSNVTLIYAIHEPK